MLEEIDQLEREGLGALTAAADSTAIESWRIRYLGTKGALKALMPRLKDVPAADKPAVGGRLNALKQKLETAFEERRAAIAAQGGPSGPIVDVTLPGHELGLGRRHILSRTIDEITEVFARMGFAVATGPEMEDERHNFEALNIPPDHPARSETDNFYLNVPGMLLRSQTSTVQIRAMEAQKQRGGGPLKVMSVGRVYRPDSHDATHFSMFHQVEGLCVDRGVSMVHLKSTLLAFARAYFGEEAEVRLRPSFFPFTEPSAELDMKMKLRGEYRWVELGGCGMVDPNVFEAVGYDPEEWTGYAFGMGIERIAMRRYGIGDIRWLFENDVRFLRQF